MISYGRQSISDEEVDAVTEVLRSDFLTQGPKVREFEQAIQSYTQANYTVALSSGTAALHVACGALGLAAGDRLWTCTNSFVASANCGIYWGAVVDLVDSDPHTRNMSLAHLEKKLGQAKAEGLLPKILVVVHFAGVPCDMVVIAKLAKEYHFKVIEDAAHAMGSRYGNHVVGCCKYSDITTFSFHPVKNMTCGEGGALCCNDGEVYQNAKRIMSHGIVREVSQLKDPTQAPWYYEQQTLGFNYRLTDIQAAIGIVQLRRLDDFIIRRRYLVERYQELLKGLPLGLPFEPEHVLTAWHIYVVETESLDVRDRLLEGLRRKDIIANIHYIPIHFQPFYQEQFGFSKGDYPTAEGYYSRALTLPLYPSLTDKEQDYVCRCIVELLCP